MINLLSIGLLGGHVSQFALDQIFSGFGIVAGGFGNTKVDNFNLAFVGNQYILGINVPVNNF